MTLDELREKYGNIELHEGFEYFIVKPKIGKVYGLDEVNHGDLLWLCNSYGHIECFHFTEDDEYHHNLLFQGNIFFDEESAIDESERRRVYHAVEKYAYKFSKEEWKDFDIKKYYPYYLQEDKEIGFSHVLSQSAEMYFKQKSDIQKAIDEVGEDDFIKYYLGVEL